MNNEHLNIICNYLELGRPLTTPKQVYGGLLHLMWMLETDKGKYAIKQLSKNIDFTEEVKQSYELSENIAKQFAENEIPAIVSLSKQGKSLIEIEGNIYIMYPWMEAKDLDKDEVRHDYASRIAQLLAQMHLLNLNIPEITKPKYDINRDDKILGLIEQTGLSSLPFRAELQSCKTLIIEINKKYRQSIPTLSKVTVVSHGDLDQKNVLWDVDNNPYIIDWESARALNPTQEMLNLALDWSGIASGFLNMEIFISTVTAYKLADGAIDYEGLDVAFNGVLGNLINWLVYNLELSLKDDLPQSEQKLSIDQVFQALRTISYLKHSASNLKHNILKII